MKDWLELFGMLALTVFFVALGVSVAALFFAAPGYVVLLIIGHESIGYWNSAAAGLGTVVLGTLIIGIINAIRG